MPVAIIGESCDFAPAASLAADLDKLPSTAKPEDRPEPKFEIPSAMSSWLGLIS